MRITNKRLATIICLIIAVAFTFAIAVSAAQTATKSSRAGQCSMHKSGTTASAKCPAGTAKCPKKGACKAAAGSKCPMNKAGQAKAGNCCAPGAKKPVAKKAPTAKPIKVSAKK